MTEQQKPISFRLHLPPRELSPNARGHWRKRWRAGREYKAQACGVALDALGPGRPAPCWKRARVRIVWYTKTRRHPDHDNAVAWLKAAFDGLTDAKIIADDNELTPEPIEFRVDREKPRVVFTVTPVPEKP